MARAYGDLLGTLGVPGSLTQTRTRHWRGHQTVSRGRCQLVASWWLDLVGRPSLSDPPTSPWQFGNLGLKCHGCDIQLHPLYQNEVDWSKKSGTTFFQKFAKSRSCGDLGLAEWPTLYGKIDPRTDHHIQKPFPPNNFRTT